MIACEIVGCGVKGYTRSLHRRCIFLMIATSVVNAMDFDAHSKNAACRCIRDAVPAAGCCDSVCAVVTGYFMPMGNSLISFQVNITGDPAVLFII